MKSTRHPSNNHELGAPPDWDQKEMICDTLPVTLGWVEGHKVIHSFWLPDPQEMAKLLAGQPVMLTVFGEQHPPVSLGVLA